MQHRSPAPSRDCFGRVGTARSRPQQAPAPRGEGATPATKTALAVFREGSRDAPPVLAPRAAQIGQKQPPTGSGTGDARRNTNAGLASRPEAVVLSYERYLQLAGGR